MKLLSRGRSCLMSSWRGLRENLLSLLLLFLLLIGVLSCRNADKEKALGPDLNNSMVKNLSFESNVGEDLITDWSKIVGWSGPDDGNSGIEKNPFYSPVDGKWYAFQRGNGDYIKQETECTISSGETYSLQLWARSINEPGNAAITAIEVKFFYDTTTILKKTVNLNPPQLKGVAANTPNDDGANVWIDGQYRHQFADVHMYQPIDYDPIEDPWLLVQDGYQDVQEKLGWAVGPVIAGKEKFIFGTRYRDDPASFFSSITMTKVISSDGPNYIFSDPATILSHKGSEFPWVEDPHCYYDEETGRLWMAWGGGTCYVSELDPNDGKLINHPANSEFDVHGQSVHTPVATWPETKEGWRGDQWSKCWMEGAALYKYNGYWYFFGSYGNLSKDYTIRYGRGDNPRGPFYDKDGVNLMSFDPKKNAYGNTILLGAEGEQLVPGHPHIWQENGKFYLGYDYRKKANEEMDYMGIRRLYWVDNWPTIYTPITLSFNADDFPNSIGKKLGISFRNAGDSASVMAVDLVTLNVKK